AAFRSAPVVLNPQCRVASTVVRYGGQGQGASAGSASGAGVTSSRSSGPGSGAAAIGADGAVRASGRCFMGAKLKGCRQTAGKGFRRGGPREQARKRKPPARRRRAGGQCFTESVGF